MDREQTLFYLWIGQNCNLPSAREKTMNLPMAREKTMNLPMAGRKQ